MVNGKYLRLIAADRSYFALIKKQVAELLATSTLSAKRKAETDIVLSEMLSNLSKHTSESGGVLLVRLVEENKRQGIEILCMDGGPGIPDLRTMMRDGESSTLTLGQGLGAMRRLSDVFQVYTQKGWGTVLLSRILDEPPAHRVQPSRPAKPEIRSLDIQSLIVAKPGETECGDNFCWTREANYIRLFLGDGLGHGKEAAHAVDMAVAAFRECTVASPREVLRFIHESVKKSRGLVGTVATFDIRQKRWNVCGIGNISTRFWGVTIHKTPVSYNGILGLNIPGTLHDQSVEYEVGQMMIMCSDGISSKWDISRFPGIVRHDLALVNAVIFKEFARNTDDTSVISCKLTLENAAIH
jgi:anti-sigma regulatory factor (Ser/Thr protein kinase)